MTSRDVGQWLIVIGLGMALLGVLAYFGLFSWFGRLPGDLRFESERVRIYVPLTSMILLSVALSLILYLIRRLL